MARLSIKEVLGRAEPLNACFGNTVLAPELVPLGAILGEAVRYNVSAVSALDDEDFPHLVMWKLFLMLLYFIVAWLQDHVAILAIVDGFEDCLVPFVYPVFSHSSDRTP